MLGAPDWRERARALHARYLFWGQEEKRAYASSAQPWQGKAAVVASGFWGTIYDLERARPAAPPVVAAASPAGHRDDRGSSAARYLFARRSRPLPAG